MSTKETFPPKIRPFTTIEHAYTNAMGIIDTQRQEIDSLRARLAEVDKELAEKYQAIVQYGKELTQSKESIAELVKDKERLDWLEKSPCRVYRFKTGATLKTCDDDSFSREVFFIDTSSIRQAIDAAIAKGGTQ